MRPWVRFSASQKSKIGKEEKKEKGKKGRTGKGRREGRIGEGAKRITQILLGGSAPIIPLILFFCIFNSKSPQSSPIKCFTFCFTNINKSMHIFLTSAFYTDNNRHLDFFFCFVLRDGVTQQPRLTLTSWLSYLSLPRVGITGMSCYTWLCFNF